MNHSSGGSLEWCQARCRGRAGMARWPVLIPGGTRTSIPFRRRQLTAKADTPTSSRSDSAASAPPQKTPTPVGLPSNGVASNPTDKRPGSAVADRSGGTGGSLAHPPVRAVPPRRAGSVPSMDAQPRPRRRLAFR